MSGNDMDYADKAFLAFNKIMANKQKDMLENMNRVNKGELFVLHFLSTNDAAVLPTEISTALQASTSRISALLGTLEKKGQITRDIDKSDRRNILVTITEEGSKRAKTEMQELRTNMTRVFTEMGEADTTEFLRLSKLFFEIMQKNMTCH